MPSGGARQGQPGKSYANRSDLNVNRAPMPGASVPAEEQPSGTGRPMITPDSIPTLDEPTQFPDQPVTAGLPFGDGPNEMAAPVPVRNTLLEAALMRNPDNPDLQRIVAYMNARGNA